MNINLAKLSFGTVVAAFSAFIGGIDGIMIALVVFMSLDYVSGVAAAAKKRELSSEVGFWGLVRKICIIAMIGVANLIDVNVVGKDVFRTAVSLYYIGNEGLSLLENFGELGVKYPEKIRDILIQLKSENEE
jgi:toxin secretion/phage lysis holin